MLATERDSGTLSLIGVTGTPLATVVTGKILARTCVVIAPLLVALGTTWVVAEQVDGVWLGRLALAAAAIAAYALLWVVAAAAVNIWMTSGSGHAVVLVGLWLAWAVIVPAGLQTLIQTLWPAPDRAALIIAGRDADPEVSRDGRRALDRFYGDHPELAPSMSITARQDNRRQLFLVFLANQQAVDALASDFDARVNQRRAAVQRWGWLAPPAALQDLLASLSGTDLKRQASFQRQVGDLVMEHRRYFAPLIVQWQPWTPALAERIPKWRFNEPGTAALREVWPNWAALLGWILLATGATALGARSAGRDSRPDTSKE
jgi:ABC-2 type transport system permease protein